ncbi:MAG: tetratricopeptide repeat protein [bacterium]|nr:tetratricopeptide repeat protein [bacterium]
MGRFDHLEMDDDPSGELDPLPGDRDIIDHVYYLDAADEAFAVEDYERALSYYSRSLQYDINTEDAWLGQLRCLIEMRELQEAVVWSDRAMERMPNSAVILAARGMAEARLGRMEKAIGFSDAALAAKGVKPFVWIARGDVLIVTSNDSAKACFYKGVEMAPGDWRVRSAIAQAYLIRGRFHQALENLRHAVRLDSNRFYCWYWIGRCCEELGEVKDAAIAYKRALSIKSDFKRAQEALAQLNKRRSIWTGLGNWLRRLRGG